MVVTLANVILRQARNSSNARQYILNIIDAKFTSVNSQGGAQIVATTVNGKSTTLQSLPGMNLSQFLAASELALSSLEAGLNTVPRSTYAVTR